MKTYYDTLTHDDIWRNIIYYVYLEFWIRDIVSERTHSPPLDDCKSLSVKTPKEKKWVTKNIQRTKKKL